MENRFLLSVFIVFFVTIRTGLQASCNGVKYITIDDARRSTAYNSTSMRPWLCDRSIIQDNAWYRFNSGEAGAEIPTSKPNIERCGTYAPIWMRGSHPTVEEGIVKRRACVVIPTNGCAHSYDINVRNCRGYYIYQLKKPTHCYNAYCAGSKLPNCTNADPDDYCLENRPPYISMPDRLYTFANSTLQLVLNATDPEGYPIKHYGYVPNVVRSISNKEGLFTMSLMTSANITFTVKDYGDLQTNHTILFIVKNCRCQNGGKCYTNDKTNVSTKSEDHGDACDCVEPYTGKFCELSPCDELPCFPGLKCSVNADSYRCQKCPVQFQGDGKDCKLIPNDETAVVEAQLTIVSGLNWSDDLSIKTSLFYKQQTAEIVAQIIQTYNGTKDFLFPVVVAYRKGSVVVDFQVVLKKKIGDALKPLRTRIQHNGTLGRFKVDLSSVKEERTYPVKGELNLTDLEWKDDLLNKGSPYYNSVAYQVIYEIDKIYAGEKEYIYVFVSGFRYREEFESLKKSLIVNYTLVWSKNVNNPLDKLKNETKGCKLGTLVIDTKCAKEKTPTVAPTAPPTAPPTALPTVASTVGSTVDSTGRSKVKSGNESYFGLDKVVFIVVVTLVSILALVSIVVCGVCIKRKPISIIMLTRNDDQREIYPSNSNNESCFNMEKRPSHNQVVNLDNVSNDRKNAW